MKRLIYRYLYGTYYWLDNRLWSGPNTYASIRSISDDLVIVFGLTKKQTKWYLKSWCKRNPKFDFNKAWKDVIKLNVKSVEVRPMQAPICGTQYLDAGYVYAPYIPVLQTPKVVEWDHAIPDRLVSRYTTRYVNPNYFR